jgi:mRNA interferase RelE/StbE
VTGPRYQVEFTPAAARQLRKLEPAGRRQVQAVVDLLAEDPRPPGVKKLVGGAGEWRVRSGTLRVVYEIHDGRLVVLVVAVGQRRDIYRSR